MKKRNHKNNQLDLLAQDSHRMQWESFAENERYQVQCLLAQLVFSLLSHWANLQHKPEHCHAVENNV